MNLKSSSLALLITILALFSSRTFATEVCSISVNGDEEKKVFQQKGYHVTELANDQNAHWLDDACKSNRKCDILLISGHFGGMFFGKDRSTLDLDELLKKRCQVGSCEGILNAPQVLLMGCNTLAGREPDKRSISEYIKVLMQDGFTREMAEKQALARYANFGFSMEEKMSVIFNQSQNLYGFNSTSYIGVINAPKFSKLLNTGLNPSTFRTNFSGESTKIVSPINNKSILDKKNLTCSIQSTDKNIRANAYQQIMKEGDVSIYFDQFLKNKDDAALACFKDNPIDLKSINLLKSADNNLSEYAALKFTADSLLKNLGIMSEKDFNHAFDLVMKKNLQSGLNYLSLDELCTAAKNHQVSQFKTEWIQSYNQNNKNKPYFAHLLSCFEKVDSEILQQLENETLNSATPSFHRESLRALRGRASPEFMSALRVQMKFWKPSEQQEAKILLRQTQAAPLPNSWKNCTNKFQWINDDQRWQCFNAAINDTSLDLEGCEAMAAQFKTINGQDSNWDCIKKFKSSLGTSICQEISSHFSDKVTADNVLFNCWDTLRSNQGDGSSINRSECLSMMSAMNFKGTQIKQNWNCLNQIQDDASR